MITEKMIDELFLDAMEENQGFNIECADERKTLLKSIENYSNALCKHFFILGLYKGFSMREEV